MKTVKNLTHRPLRLPLPRGKVLHLGPAKTGQIADDAAGHPPLLKLIEAKEIEVLGHGSVAPVGGAGGGPAPHESTHGHAPAAGAAAPRRGNRGA